MATLIEWLRDMQRRHPDADVMPFKETADALEKLRAYVVHDEDCGVTIIKTDGDRPCTCGLSALLRDIGHDDT